MAVNSTNPTQPQSKPAEISANVSSREQLLQIPPKTVVDLDFLNTSPNYVYINNYSPTTLYFGRSVLPSASVYDMVIPGNGDNLYAAPNGFRAAYLYNDGADITNCKITSFIAPFEPSSLKGGGGTATAPGGGGIATDVNALITGFNVPLPAGNNHVGVVTVDSMPAQTLTMTELPAGANHIGSVYIDQMVALPQGTSHIGSVGIDGGLTITSMPPVQVSDTPVATAHQYYENNIDSAITNMVSFVMAAPINTINFLSNDGTTDLWIGFDTVDPSVPANRANGQNTCIHLLAGEALSNFGRKTSQINFFRTTGAGTVRFVGA
jgi:hypothetical protein